MSANWIIFIPTEPTFIPDGTTAQSAVALLEQLMPDADQIRIVQEDHPVFVDAGANFKSINCPVCQAELTIEWWDGCMELAFLQKFCDLLIHTPCCHLHISLNDLAYDWPQGFSQWRLEAVNPNVGKLSKDQTIQLIRVLKHPLRVVYRHL
jgi:hypothetical protein